MIITILFCEVCAQFLGARYRITGCYIYSLLLLSSEQHPGYVLREITIASSVSDAANKIIRTLVRERDVSVQILSQLVCQDSGDKSKWVYLISCQCPPPPQYTHAPSASCDISYFYFDNQTFYAGATSRGKTSTIHCKFSGGLQQKMEKANIRDDNDIF